MSAQGRFVVVFGECTYCSKAPQGAAERRANRRAFPVRLRRAVCARNANPCCSWRFHMSVDRHESEPLHPPCRCWCGGEQGAGSREQSAEHRSRAQGAGDMEGPWELWSSAALQLLYGAVEPWSHGATYGLTSFSPKLPSVRQKFGFLCVLPQFPRPRLPRRPEAP